MSLRMLPLLIALALSLAPSSQAAFVSAPPASSPPSTSENAHTAFLPNESESRIGLLCGNDPLDKTDPMGLDPGTAVWAGQSSGGALEGERAAPQPTPRVVRDITRSVIGSNIPQRIRYTESGNWNDRKIANHYDAALESKTGRGGQTVGKAKVDTAGSNVNINLRVDWFVDSKYRDTNVVTRELEHVQGFRDLSKGIDVSLLSSGLSTSYLSGLPASVRNFAFRQQLEYDWPPNSGKPHDLKAHPAMPVMLPEDETPH